MLLLGLIVYLAIAIVCGCAAHAVRGDTPRGLMYVVLVGFLGASLGTSVANGLHLVTADERGSHFRRNHRYPGTHPLTRARFFALSCRRPETHVVYALACGGAPEWGGPLR